LPNPQAGCPPLVGCPRLLNQYICSYPPYWRLFLHLQPEDMPCCGDGDPLITEFVENSHELYAHLPRFRCLLPICYCTPGPLCVTVYYYICGLISHYTVDRIQEKRNLMFLLIADIALYNFAYFYWIKPFRKSTLVRTQHDVE